MTQGRLTPNGLQSSYSTDFLRDFEGVENVTVQTWGDEDWRKVTQIDIRLLRACGELEEQLRQLHEEYDVLLFRPANDN